MDVSLWDELGGFPDVRVTGKNQSCGSYNFGVMQRPDRYYFKIEKVNGATKSAPFNVKSVVQTY